MQLASKKINRIERKKKKLSALIEISEMNNKDRTELTSAFNRTIDDQVEVMESSGLAERKRTLKLGQDDDSSPRESKKKHKSRHLEESGEGSRQKHKSQVKDVWPPSALSSRSDDYSQKRKSSFELENYKEQHLKMVKRQSADHGRSQQYSSSFVEELESFKKDLARNKKKKEKRKRKDPSSSLSLERAEADEAKQDKSNVVQTEQEPPDTDKPDSEGELAELRKLLRERKRQLKEIPHVRLKGVGKDANLELLDSRTPVIPCDVQNFILLSQLGHYTPRFPRWVELAKFNRLSKTVVLVVEGVSAYDFLSAESSCPELSTFDIKAEMVSPYCYNCNIVEELCAVPLSTQEKKNLEKKFGKEICPEALMTDKVIKVLRSAFSITSVPKTINNEVEQKIRVPPMDKFPRTDLLLSAWQLIEEGYPLPYSSTELGNRYPDYVMTKDQYSEVTPSSPMWAVDCEMCLTSAGNELTRVSVVDEQHKTVYESLCLPRNPIKNYLTEFSGITPAMLKGVTVRLEDIQRDLRALFPSDVILVGQSLGGDLHALKMMHPYVIDTSVIFNLTGVRRHKSRLSKLAMEFLNESIQQHGARGHDSVEDSLAALKLVQHKLTKSIEYGDAVLSGLKEVNTSEPEHHAHEFEDLRVEVGPMMATSLFKHIAMHKKSVVVIGQEETLAEYSTFVAAAHRESKNLVKTVTTVNSVDAVSKTCFECKQANFTLAHLVLSEEEDVTLVDSWMKRIVNSPPFNSLFIVVLVGSHKSFANGACLAKVKKPNLKLKTCKTN